MDPPAAPVPIETLLAQRPWVRALARSLVRDDNAADDVAQDAWVAALMHPPHDEATSRGWLAVVARNLVRARGRSEGRRAAREEAAARPEAQPAADEVVAQAEIHRRVVEETMALAEPYRTTVLLRYFEGLPLADIAARMDAPLETVRTRLRRAHEQLRERLAPVRDRDGRAALLVLAGNGGTGDGAAGSGVRASRRAGVARWAGVVALLAGAALTALLVVDALRGERSAHGAGAVAAAPDGGAGGGGGAPVPPPAAPADEGASDKPAAPATNDAAPAAPAAPPADAAGDLRLRIATDPATPRSGDSFELVATFENGGKGHVRLFVPQHAGAQAFPAWRFVAEDGTAFVPASWIGQSMWQDGLQGSLVELGPGETWSCRTDVSAFSPVDASTGKVDDWHVRVPLRPGRYVISAAYEKADRDVPWSEEAFKVVYRRIDDVWTGKVRAADVAVQIERPSRPTLTIDAPHEIVPGRAYVVAAVVENPGTEDAEFAGSLVCRAYTKGDGAIATYRPAAKELTAGADAVTASSVRVAAGASVRLAFDLSRCGDFTRRGTSYVYLVASIEKGADAPALQSNALIRSVKPPPDASAAGLRLRVSTRKGANGEPLVEVTLTNAGQAALRVPRDLAAPATVSFRVRRRDVPAGADRTITIEQGTSSWTTETVDWSVTAPSHEGPPLADDFAELRPGESMSRSFDLSAAQHPALPAGAYELTAAWSNFDRGVRAGLAEDAVVVGATTAEPVPLDR